MSIGGKILGVEVEADEGIGPELGSLGRRRREGIPAIPIRMGPLYANCVMLRVCVVGSCSEDMDFEMS